MYNISQSELREFIPYHKKLFSLSARIKSLKKAGSRFPFIVFLYVILPFAALLFSLCMGRYTLHLKDVLSLLFLKATGGDTRELAVIDTILFRVRLPRIIAAMLIGSSLSLSGTVYQSTFRNPMVSPGILGVANGAGFGAALGILLSFSFIGIQLTAFAFGIAAVLITFGLSKILTREGDSLIALVLTGMVISTIFSSLISLTKYTADPYDKLPAITFWLMGSLASVTKDDILFSLTPIILGSIPLILLRWKLNLMSFGDNEARSMGIDTTKLRIIVIVCSTIITAASIAISGIIGWVGLIIPHLCRFITGPDHKKLVPLSMVIGAVYLTLVDDCARTLTNIEIPLGIITSLIGAPFFIYLMFKKRKNWQ